MKKSIHKTLKLKNGDIFRITSGGTMPGFMIEARQAEQKSFRTIGRRNDLPEAEFHMMVIIRNAEGYLKTQLI